MNLSEMEQRLAIIKSENKKKDRGDLVKMLNTFFENHYTKKKLTEAEREHLKSKLSNIRELWSDTKFYRSEIDANLGELELYEATIVELIKSHG
jgi:hypothetical protein